MCTEHAGSYSCFRRFPEALRKLDQVLNITPDDLDTLVQKAAIAQAEWESPIAPSALYRNYCRYHTAAHWRRACRSLPRCSDSIQCSIRSGTMRASKNSPLLNRRHRTNKTTRSRPAMPSQNLINNRGEVDLKLDNPIGRGPRFLVMAAASRSS